MSILLIQFLKALETGTVTWDTAQDGRTMLQYLWFIGCELPEAALRELFGDAAREGERPANTATRVIHGVGDAAWDEMAQRGFGTERRRDAWYRAVDAEKARMADIIRRYIPKAVS